MVFVTADEDKVLNKCKDILCFGLDKLIVKMPYYRKQSTDLMQLLSKYP